MRIELAGEPATRLELSRREICWPFTADPQGAGGRVALRVRVELGIGTTVEEPWALRLARDPRAVRVISGEPGTLTRWVILEHARGQDLPPGRYFVSVPLRRAGEQTTLQAPSEVLRCVFY